MHMRQLLLCGCSLIIVSACSQSGSLPAAEVLHRSVIAADGLMSAQMSLEAAWRDPSSTVPEVRVAMDGLLRDGGRLIASTVELETGERSLEGDVVVEWGRDLYLRLTTPADGGADSLPIPPARWYVLELSSNVPVADATLTPDPHFLQAQSATVRVTRDRGRELIHGRDAYHYDVTLDREKLRSLLREFSSTPTAVVLEDPLSTWDDAYIAGELWIDSETFLIHRIHWRIAESGEESAMLEFSLDVSAHNEPVSIEVPTDAEPIVPDALQHWMIAPISASSSSSLVP